VQGSTGATGATGAAGTAGGFVCPDTYPAVENAANDEFDGAALDTAGTRFAGATAWAWLNQPAGATATLVNGYLKLFNNVVTPNWAPSVIGQAQAGAAWEYQAKVRCSPMLGGAGLYYFVGLMVYNSGNGHLVTFNFLHGASTVVHTFRGDCWSSFTTDASQVGASFPAVFPALPYNECPFVYLSMTLASGTLTFKYSFDGVTWYTYPSTEAVATYPGAITSVGLFAAGQGATYNLTGVIDWFRRIS
jgi:hypothetical protein